jgi:hypothetical protein
VVDDLPPSIPVSSRELEVLETYLNSILDDLFGYSTGPRDNGADASADTG